MRTGGIFETLKYDHAVTALQFDTRKIVAATGENGVKVRHFPMCTLPCMFCYYVPFWDITAPMGIACLSSVLCHVTLRPPHGADCVRSQIYNRTSMQQSTLLTNGHTRPVERLRYMDRYMVSGGRDSVVKIWAL